MEAVQTIDQQLSTEQTHIESSTMEVDANSHEKVTSEHVTEDVAEDVTGDVADDIEEYEEGEDVDLDEKTETKSSKKITTKKDTKEEIKKDQEQIKKIAKSIKVSKKHLKDAIESEEEEEEEEEEKVEKPQKKSKEAAMKELAELAVANKKKGPIIEKIAKAEKEAKKIGLPNKMMSSKSSKKQEVEKSSKKRKIESEGESESEEEKVKPAKKSKSSSGKATTTQVVRKSVRSNKGSDEKKEKKSKKIERLSSKDALIKYRARLSMIDEEDFAELDACWISIYDPSLKEETKFKEGIFPIKWTKVLKEVAAEKGANIIGVLPHYGRSIEGTKLKFFKVKPEIVEKDLVSKYKKAGVKNVEGKRVYVGKTVGAGREQQSDFCFLASDTHKDKFWDTLQEVLDASDSESE